MDPYKVLGVSASSIKHESDLIPARKRAKTLFKRYSAEKKKFDAKKVLEAFEMIKQNFKGRLGEGQNKILGRSRKERDLDKHFNHQTKEIKKDKKLKRTLQAAQHGEKRIHLRGDKERVARPRRRRAKRSARKKEKKKKTLDSVQGLVKLSKFLQSQEKFPKAMPLLNRWVREYMNQDNRGYILEVLHVLAGADYITEDSDSRQEVIQVFEYVLGYFSAWFEEGEKQKMLAWAWRVSCVQACHCHTDDAFMLSRTISTLNEALALLEANKEKVQEELPSPNELPVGMPSPQGSPLLSEPGDNGEEMEYYPSVSDSDDEDNGGAKDEKQVGLKEEVKEEKLKTEFKEEDPKVEVKEEKLSKEEIRKRLREDRKKKEAIALDSDDDVKKEEVIDSGDDVNEVDSVDSVNSVGSDLDDDSDAVYESLSSGQSSDVEQIDDPFASKLPSAAVSLGTMSEHLVFRCLGTLFEKRGPLWARSKIDNFFQDVFYRRAVFTPHQITQVEAWQARIKVLQKGGERGVGEANNPLEAHRPVVDSREMRTVTDATSNAWAAKQTFDSRDSSGGSRVIR